MAVPSSDERDFEFASEYELPILPVYDPDVENNPQLIPIEYSAKKTKELVLNGQLCWSGPGTCINSSSGSLSLNGLPIEEAKEKIIEWLEKHDHGKKSISYKLRDWLFSRQRYWGEPFPILHFEDGTKRVLELDELPLTPPELTNFKPSGDGRSPLAKVTNWVEITDPKTGRPAHRETNTMPQWAGSCWYYLRFLDPQNDEKAWEPAKEKYWMPVDLYIGGVEHAVLHLLYARFWHKVLFDLGYVSGPEPFKSLRNQGLIVSAPLKNLRESMFLLRKSSKEEIPTPTKPQERCSPLKWRKCPNLNSMVSLLTKSLKSLAQTRFASTKCLWDL